MRILTITLLLLAAFLNFTPMPVFAWLLMLPGFLVWCVICVIAATYLDEYGVDWGWWDS